RELRDALEPSRVKLLRQFTSLSDGVKFLVDLRADLHDLANGDPILRDLEGDLRELLSSWFDVGFLELRRITWDAPAALLEKLAGYEAVHEMRGWQDLKARLGGFGPGNRRCFAFLHPLMPGEPLIFVEVALVREMAAAIGPLLDRATPAVKPEDAEAAIFYSISNCQRGLAGISFGNALIKRVVAELNAELPNLRIFATLSPIPGFMRWLDGHTAEGEAPLRAMLSRRGWNRDPAVVEALREPLMRLCAHYLLEERRNGDRVLDPVAHFHLSNGARVERLNWLGDISAKGLRESAGLMVNYLYKLDQIDANHEAYAAEGRVIASSSIRGLLR
ncbi:MAG: malonyl-CoA decarboxylase, partial [bacterium]|nr:malonyl-CoA decarboxylase [bacterium]